MTTKTQHGPERGNGRNQGGTEHDRDHERLCTARRIAVEDLAREIRSGRRPVPRAKMETP